MSLRELSTPALLAWGAPVVAGARSALAWGASHTGLPVLVVAAMAVVLSWRVLRQSARFLFEVAVVAALLLAATRAGWIAW